MHTLAGDQMIKGIAGVGGTALGVGGGVPPLRSLPLLSAAPCWPARGCAWGWGLASVLGVPFFSALPDWLAPPPYVII